MAPAAGLDVGLDLLEQVVHLVVEFVLAVARHAEGDGPAELHAGEQVAQMEADHLFERHERVAGAAQSESFFRRG